jgi:hypothetical protein
LQLVDGLHVGSLFVDDEGLDLATYREAAARLHHACYCFVNSFSVILAPDWIAHMHRALRTPGVGIVGASGSFESALSAAPPWLRLLRRRAFPPFPNPHLRTNGFMIARDLLLELDWPRPRSKAAAWRLESGGLSISRQVWGRGLDVRVVGRAGVVYPAERWRESATFRSGGQANLLVADNRTRQYDDASPAMRAHLERLAWGDQSSVSMPSWVAPASRVTRK